MGGTIVYTFLRSSFLVALAMVRVCRILGKSVISV
jgi:hypothetical protein